MPSLEELYGSFGTLIVETVRQEIALNGDLSGILAKLNLSTPASLNTQHEALRSFLYRFGVAFLLMILKSNWSEEELERQKAMRIAATVRPSAIGAQTSAQARREASRTLPPQQPSITPSPTVVFVTAPSPTPTQHAPAPVEEPPKEVVLVDTPGYKGPERRSGQDRRVGPTDRRSQLTAVHKNRRYGGKDRRKIIRRACDRERLAKKN